MCICAASPHVARFRKFKNRPMRGGIGGPIVNGTAHTAVAAGDAPKPQTS
jgi:hypothetical protein